MEQPRSYSVTVPLLAPAEERQALIDDIADLYTALVDQGVDPVADVQATPEGDRWTVQWWEPVAA